MFGQARELKIIGDLSRDELHVSFFRQKIHSIKSAKMLKFYEKVSVKNNCRFSEYIGKEGHVLGVSEEDGVVFGYAVTFDYGDRTDDLEGAFFEPEELQGTGEIAPREMFYSGDAIRVHRDDQGRGYIADN